METRKIAAEPSLLRPPADAAEVTGARQRGETRTANGGTGAPRAVIDVGSNSLRLAVARTGPHAADLQILASWVAETRLGANSGGDHRIGEQPLARTAHALEALVKQAREMGAVSVRIVATSAVREAANRAEVCRVLEDAAGLPLEVLSGAEEARLSFLGASADFCRAGEIPAVLDIGGGSTELAYPRPDGTLHSGSVPVGAVRLLEHPDFSRPARELLRTLVGENTPRGGTFVATGGTCTCLMALELGLPRYDGSLVHGKCLTRARVDAWQARLSSLTLRERQALPGMKASRADILPYGVWILQQMLALLGRDSVVISDKGLVHGLLLESASRA